MTKGKLIKVNGVEVLIWNTERNYSAFGQRIAATLVGKGIVFIDFDMQVTGFILTTKFTRREIMSWYVDMLYAQVYSIKECAAEAFLWKHEGEILMKLEEENKE